MKKTNKLIIFILFYPFILHGVGNLDKLSEKNEIYKELVPLKRTSKRQIIKETKTSLLELKNSIKKTRIKKNTKSSLLQLKNSIKKTKDYRIRGQKLINSRKKKESYKKRQLLKKRWSRKNK